MFMIVPAGCKRKLWKFICFSPLRKMSEGQCHFLLCCLGVWESLVKIFLRNNIDSMKSVVLPSNLPDSWTTWVSLQTMLNQRTETDVRWWTSKIRWWSMSPRRFLAVTHFTQVAYICLDWACLDSSFNSVDKIGEWKFFCYQMKFFHPLFCIHTSFFKSPRFDADILSKMRNWI